jgi:L-alanine-DL-glutamate epimerase-like enolase superfamily enzyme
MKVVKLEAIPVRIPYKRVEASSLIARSGVADVLVKVTTEDGIVGWGECTRAADVPGIESAVNAMAPLVVGRSAWDREIMQRELAVYAVWAFQPMTANFAFAGIDMALWDACGKACGQPLYRLFGGAMREEVDYFYYMEWGTPKEIARQAKDGVKKGYRAYYIKAGVDERKEEAMLEALRDGIGPDGLIRIDVNQAWDMPTAVRLLKRWHRKFTIDFAEAPVRIDPIENNLDLMKQVDVPICVNEGLWREADAWRIIKSRGGHYLCFSQYWVGSLARWHMMCHAGHQEGWLVCKRVRPHRRRRPAHHADHPQRLPRPPADRPDDGGRYTHRTHPHRRRPTLGKDRRTRPRRRGRRGQGREVPRRLPQAWRVPDLCGEGVGEHETQAMKPATGQRKGNGT